LFYAYEVPRNANGGPLGDTQLASATAAYNALPGDIQKKISGRKAV